MMQELVFTGAPGSASVFSKRDTLDFALAKPVAPRNPTRTLESVVNAKNRGRPETDRLRSVGHSRATARNAGLTMH